MALSDMTDLATWPPFIRKVTAAAITAAENVGAEEFDGSNYKLQRRALVKQVLEDPALWGSRFAYAAAANPAINFGSTDNDIQFTVNSVWDAMAGAYQEVSP
jgi:hypothetical protein